MKTTQIDLGTQTIQKIINYIDQHHFKDGDRLPTESQWQMILKCGRSTIREAMQVLAHSGLVIIKQGSGTFVQKRSTPQELKKQLRATIKMLENEAIHEVTDLEVADDDWLILKAHLSRRNQLLEAGKIDEFISADWDFHYQIIKMSQNQYLISWYNQLQTQWHNFISQIVISHDKYRGNLKQHNQFFEKLVERKADAAVKLNNLFAR